MKTYRAVFSEGKTKVAVNLEEFKLPIPIGEAEQLLSRLGFQSSSLGKKVPELLGRVPELCGRKYRRGAKLREAPEVFDCSSFVKYIFSQFGIWLPRRSIQQFQHGTVIKIEEIRAGDVVFTSGACDYYIDDPSQGVGHVGIAIGDDCRVVHAANAKTGVVASALAKFIYGKDGNMVLRGIRRILPPLDEFFVVECPSEREIETSDDIRWIIYQNL